ncbi:MAG TPA: DUF5615 family PIN-like protein [Chthonomonadaceae bacterium]|nr:DUF5615 family PIN-like protein [Chthonomonadaceae bacterium]
MLAFLLDQQISPQIAVQVQSKRPEIPILSLYSWRGGTFVGIADTQILHAAAEDGRTLVTYDRKTIAPLLKEWGASGLSHGGVVFVDNFTIASNDFGRLVRSLIYFWDQEHTSDWTDRIGFLPAL